MAIKTPWTEKYRPLTLDGYIFQDPTQRTYLEQIIATGELPNLMLHGAAGSGKTTIARILIKALEVDEADVLMVDASKDNSVDYIRNVIIPFVESYPLGGFKVVHLEEFDYMSQAAQGTLRVSTENSTTCRFIATCNYGNKIIPALKSRFQDISFKTPIEDDVIVRMIDILDAEGVAFDPDVLYAYIKQGYPDIRKIINNLQKASSGGTLRNPKEAAVADWRFKLLDLLKACDIRGIQDLTAKEVSQDQIEEVYEFLYRNLKLVPSTADADIYSAAVLTIADSLRAHAVSGLPHITLHACCIKLMQVL